MLEEPEHLPQPESKEFTEENKEEQEEEQEGYLDLR